VLLHFAVTAIQEGILEEELDHPWLLIAPVAHWQCVLIDWLFFLGHSYLLLYTVLYCWVLVRQTGPPTPPKPLQKPQFIYQHIPTVQFSQQLIWLQTQLALFIACTESTVGRNINTGLWSEPNFWPEMFL